jgi:hypothetical protein
MVKGDTVEKTKARDHQHKRSSTRRSVIGQGAAIIGASLFGPALASAQTSPGNQGMSAHFDVRRFGATGKRGDNATAPIQAAVDACAAGGGGAVYVPPGEYTVGTIRLKDNVTLHLEGGAILLLSQSRTDLLPGSRSMIFAENANNIAVTGKGTLDGLAQYVFTEMRGLDIEIAEEIEIARKAGLDMRRYYRTGMQTYMFILNNCTNVLLRDISVINSPLWTVRMNDCDRVRIQGVYIYSDLEKGVNADGIDIVSSRNVTISDSIITTADDAIVLKTIRRADQAANPTENVTVTNCLLSSSSTPLMIGTETEADIRHVIFSNCVIRNSNKGFGINVQDGATVRDIVFSNLTIETNRRHWNWWGSSEMCKIVLKKRSPESRLGVIRDVVIDNIIAHPRGTSLIAGHPQGPLENISMSNVKVRMNPENTEDKRATDALRIEGVRGLRIRDLEVRWDEEQVEEKWRSALVLKNVTDFDIRSFTGRQGLKRSDSPAILLDNVQEGTIRDSRAAKDCGTFIHIRGEASKDITLRDNDSRKALHPISYEKANLKKAVQSIRSQERPAG